MIARATSPPTTPPAMPPALLPPLLPLVPLLPLLSALVALAEVEPPAMVVLAVVSVPVELPILEGCGSMVLFTRA
jgi:hypothetical protein